MWRKVDSEPRRASSEPHRKKNMKLSNPDCSWFSTNWTINTKMKLPEDSNEALLLALLRLTSFVITPLAPRGRSGRAVLVAFHRVEVTSFLFECWLWMKCTWKPKCCFFTASQTVQVRMSCCFFPPWCHNGNAFQQVFVFFWRKGVCFLLWCVSMVRLVPVGCCFVVEEVEGRGWGRGRPCRSAAWPHRRCCVLHDTVMLLCSLCCSQSRIKLWHLNPCVFVSVHEILNKWHKD